MATNPQFPYERRPVRDDHAHVDLGRRRRGWWPPVLIVIAILIVIGLIAWLANSPERRAAQTQVAGDQVQLTGLTAGTATQSGEMDVTANLQNNTGASVAGVTVEGTFRNIRGEELEKVQGDVVGASGSLTQNPIAAGESRPISIRFPRVPEGWNGKMPELRITNVRSAR